MSGGFTTAVRLVDYAARLSGGVRRRTERGAFDRVPHNQRSNRL